MSWRRSLAGILSALMALVVAPAWANNAPPDVSLVNPHQIDRERLVRIRAAMPVADHRRF